MPLGGQLEIRIFLRPGSCSWSPPCGSPRSPAQGTGPLPWPVCVRGVETAEGLWTWQLQVASCLGLPALETKPVFHRPSFPWGQGWEWRSWAGLQGEPPADAPAALGCCSLFLLLVLCGLQDKSLVRTSLPLVSSWASCSGSALLPRPGRSIPRGLSVPAQRDRSVLVWGCDEGEGSPR